MGKERSGARRKVAPPLFRTASIPARGQGITRTQLFRVRPLLAPKWVARRTAGRMVRGTLCPVIGHIAGTSVECAGATVRAGQSHGSLAEASPDTRRTLPVAPLIADKRCYGECPASVRRGSREGRVRDGRNNPPTTPTWFGCASEQRCTSSLSSASRTQALPRYGALGTREHPGQPQPRLQALPTRIVLGPKPCSLA